MDWLRAVPCVSCKMSFLSAAVRLGAPHDCKLAKQWSGTVPVGIS